MKLIAKIALWLTASIIVAVLALGIVFFFWQRDHERQLVAGSRIAVTPLGQIEYAVTGEGIPWLRIHGSPGGYDHSIVGALHRPQAFGGYKTIAVSRPGFLRTPLTSGRTPAEQADLYAALLDQLGIERAFVSGVSGGGSSALQFALRHPDLTLGLVLTVPALQEVTNYEGGYAPQSALAMTLQDFSVWVGTRLMIKPIAALVMPKAMPGFDADDPDQLAMIEEVADGFIPAALRAEGRANDIANYATLGIEDWPLEQSRVPTLILHGTADSNAPYAGSASVAARMPNAKLVTFDGADHLMIITKHREITRRTQAFLIQTARAAHVCEQGQAMLAEKVAEGYSFNGTRQLEDVRRQIADGGVPQIIALWEALEQKTLPGDQAIVATTGEGFNTTGYYLLVRGGCVYATLVRFLT